MELYGLIGEKLGHSFSQRYFRQKFEREGLECDYELFELSDITLLPDLLRSHPNLRGLNVTIPYKESALPYLDRISAEAHQIGAVNTIKIDRDGNGVPRLAGYNTDAAGFRKSLETLLARRSDIAIPERALILGTGGAAKAAAYSLRSMGIDPTFVSRRPEEADVNGPVFSYGDLTKEIVGAHHLIVNATPCGTFPEVEKAPQFPYHLLDNRHICHDLVYNPEETKFMRLCREMDCQVKNGAEMLENQAELSWELWQGRH